MDFLGSALLTTFLVLILLPLEIGGTKVAWTDPWIPVLFCSGAVFLVLFVLAEKYWAANPLLPLSLFCNRHTIVAFTIIALQIAAQLGVRDARCLSVLFCRGDADEGPFR